SRRHESGLFKVMEKRLALRVPQLRTWTLSHPTGADKLHRAFHGIDGRAIDSFSGAQVRPSVVCSRFREAIRVSLLSFRGEGSAVEEALDPADFRDAIRVW